MVEPLSALLMIICSFTFRLCRASLCSLVRLSVFVCVMLGNLFDISFVVSSINVFRRGLGIGFVVAFEVVFFGMNLFRVFFGLYVSVGFVLWSSGIVFFLHCMLSCLLRLIMPFSMSSLSVCLGLGMKVRPFVRTLISVLVRL